MAHMQALAEEWKKRDREREALVKKKVRKLVSMLAEESHKPHYCKFWQDSLTITRVCDTSLWLRGVYAFRQQYKN